MTNTMTMREWCLCALLTLTVATADAGVGEWRNYTSMRNVRGIARETSTYWAATSGGLFSWSASDKSYRRFTNADGLLNTDLTAVAVDASGDVWTGTSSGIIHILTPSTGTLKTILDIRDANQTTKGINAFYIQGDSVLICTQFGLSVFRIAPFGFGDTYTQFGSSSSNVRISVLSATIFDNKIWACISDGQTFNRIAMGDLNIPNLLPPESWTLQVVGSPGTVPVSLSVFAGKLYAGTTTGLYVLDNSSWTLFAPLGNEPVVSTAASAATLAITSIANAYSLDAGGTLTPVGTPLPSEAQTVVVGTDENPVLGTREAGILAQENGWVSHMPNGPGSNQFTSVAVDPTGGVWAAPGSSSPNGFYRLRDGTWKSFTSSTSPMLTDYYYRASTTCDGAVWLSSFGRGLVEVPAGTDAVDSSHVFWTDVGMVGLPNDPNFVVCSNVVCDVPGNRWTTILSASDRNLITVRTAAGSWRTLPAIINGVRVSTLTDLPVDRTLAVDASDNLWAVVRDPAFRGIVNFRNRGTTDLSNALHIVAADGLPSDDIRTLVVDRENDIWVGTDKGIAIILDPSNPKRDGGIAQYKPLLGLVINCIAVDPLNRKWIGSNQGAILLSPDGTQLLASYTVENTQGKIISNTIISIAIDDNSGTVYFGTPNGLASLTTSAAAPAETFTELKVYPNPFRLPEHTLLTVDGLRVNSSIKILTVDGRLIREIQSPGGRVGFWDGRDGEGQEVASGVYLIIAYTEDGQVANGKVAVLRN